MSIKTPSSEEGDMKVSVVMPIHNEEDLLPYSLRALLSAPAHEFIFVLDRCTDNSKNVVSRFAASVGRCKILEKREASWLNAAAEAYDFGAQYASGDWIYFIDADTVVDRRVFDPKYWQQGNAFRFRYYNYDIRGIPIRSAYEKVLLRITERLGISTGHFATVVSFKGDYWRKTRHELQSPWRLAKEVPLENIEGLRKNPTLALRGIILQEQRRYERDFVRVRDTNCLHLRPKNSTDQQELQGIARYVLGYPLWKVLLHSIMYFEIRTLIAFVHAKSGRYGDLKKWVKS
jgi:glycosyltransferase involved in cell wall biosynthesis